MMCLLILNDGRWREQELPDEFLMQADRNLDRIQRQGRIVITILDEATEVEVEYDCKDVLMDYCWFGRKGMGGNS
jgi:hypothetical protein